MRDHLFPIFDPVTEELLGYKPRADVHRNGDWHRGIQANIIRKNHCGTFDILVQQRSDCVDIGAQQYDQSLATQMIASDRLSEKVALRRGLVTELGIRRCKTHYLPLKLRIVKTYESQPDILNCELLSFYVVIPTDPRKITAHSPKVASVRWMEWNEFLTFFRQCPRRFTKTAQMYFSDASLLQQIEELSYRALRSGPLQQKHTADPSCILRIDREARMKATIHMPTPLLSAWLPLIAHA